MERKKLLTILAVTVAVSATGVFALLTNYVTITGLATVEQSVVLEECHLTWDGQSTDQCTEGTDPDATWSASASGGDTRSVGINLVNSAESTDAIVDFVFGQNAPQRSGAYRNNRQIVIFFENEFYSIGKFHKMGFGFDDV